MSDDDVNFDDWPADSVAAFRGAVWLVLSGICLVMVVRAAIWVVHVVAG